ncbi:MULTISPECIES: LysR family transcriptional regulator [Kitasatospora]|uniref:LysR family transcriptional regulator n=1 Tax=Kitasatospora TaxID=2063 RepID=UPI0009DEB973|nr:MULTISPECIES: LysR family transcriptional regulator [unclassified Kitasatospora]WAL70791.1 LysR family transcriptional regulator [Kitasatospora sp. YST-16]WNW36830.1 LysR family transcriptional regulator [Streptomyces sp. Li-HN-5-13]
MDVDTRMLRCLTVVGEEGQLTAAAARLGVSQPTLTKQVRALERQLGVELFRRSRAGMAPTAAGAELLARAGTLLAGWEEAVRATRLAAAEAGGELRVGFEGSTMSLLGRAVAEDFARRMPGWRLRLRQNDWFDESSGLASGRLDLALWHAPASMAERYAHVPLGTEERWVVLAADHRLAARTEVSVADLWDEPFVAIPEQAGVWRDYWLGAPERAGRPVRIGAVAHNADEWMAAVACGQGVGFAPRAVGRWSSRPDVRCLPVRGLGPSLVGLFRPHGRAQTPAMAAFAESCRLHLEVQFRATGGGRSPEAAAAQTSANGAG